MNKFQVTEVEVTEKQSLTRFLESSEVQEVSQKLKGEMEVEEDAMLAFVKSK